MLRHQFFTCHRSRRPPRFCSSTRWAASAKVGTRVLGAGKRLGCLGRPERIAYGTSNDRPKHLPKLLIKRNLRYFASGCGRNWNFTRIGFDTDRYSPSSTASPSSACHTVSEPVDE